MPATTKNPPTSRSQTKTQDKTIKKLTQSKFSQIEECISSVEQKIKSQNVEPVSLISKIQESTKAALEPKYNLDHTDSDLFEVSQLKGQVSHLDEEMKKRGV